MNEHVTYKHLIVTIIGVLIMISVWTSNAKSKHLQIDKNENAIKTFKEEFKSLRQDIYNNNLQVIKEISEVKLLIKDKKNRD